MATPNPIPIPQVSVNKWREESSEKLTATLSEKQPNKFAHYELVQNGNSLWRTNLYILTLSTDCFNQVIFQLDEYQYQVSSNHSLASNYIVSNRFPTNRFNKVKDKPHPFVNFWSPHSARALLLSKLVPHCRWCTLLIFLWNQRIVIQIFVGKDTKSQAWSNILLIKTK